jgi:GH15 family glucan-1,4-alpha-glucosidase
VRMCSELVIRFGYGRTIPWVSRLSGGGLSAISGPDMLVLDTPAETHGEGFKTLSDFTVRAGEQVPFVLTYGPSHHQPPKPVDARWALDRTERHWTQWARQCSADSPWNDAVTRSLITLKALTYAPTGGIVAAPTTSLPEQIGGPRNWDYRFCWLRDATLTLLSLMDSGYYDEAAAWRDWLVRAAAGSPAQMQIMYGIAGEHRLNEWEIPWLPGYENSQPVRIGNAAYSQLQLDVYGEVMDALHQARRGGLPPSPFGWELQRALLDHLETLWREPDEGIWEVRGNRQHFTYSKVMAWVAFDRMVKSAQEFGLPGDIDRWAKIRAAIHADVCDNGFNAEVGSFVQAYGSNQMDASLLLLPAVGFLPTQDPRIRATVEAVERKLMVDGFVLRYDTHKTDDGLPPGEGAFLACSFWLADDYVLQGRMEEAQALFERLLSLRNDVGLLSEEFDPVSGRLVGNFPQAFSHVALVNTAANLSRAIKPAEQRANHAAEPT